MELGEPQLRAAASTWS